MILKVSGVQFSYSSHAVLDDVTFQVEPGELVGVVGPNGAGKSTLLQVIGRSLAPSAGTVALDDDLIARLSHIELARRLAVVRQRETVSLDFTVEEVVLLGRFPYIGRFGRESAADLAAVHAALEATGIAHLRTRPVSQLSGGEFQRVAIARALAQETPVLLLDEPTSSLDLKYQVEVLILLTKLAASGRTVVTTLHELNMASQHCHRLILMHEGRIRAAGRPAEVLTPALLDEVYGVSTIVTVHPHTGKPLVFPCYQQPALRNGKLIVQEAKYENA